MSTVTRIDHAPAEPDFLDRLRRVAHRHSDVPLVRVRHRDLRQLLDVHDLLLTAVDADDLAAVSPTLGDAS